MTVIVVLLYLLAVVPYTVRNAIDLYYYLQLLRRTIILRNCCRLYHSIHRGQTSMF